MAKAVKMEKDNIVVCLNDAHNDLNNTNVRLTNGKVYVVKGVTEAKEAPGDETVLVVCDDGEERWVYASRFKLKINFRKLMANNIDGSSDDVNFCIKFAEEHQLKGDMEDDEIMEGLIGILAMNSNRNKSREIIRFNEMIVEGIQGLRFMGHWPNLGRAAKHALSEEVKCLEAEPDKPFIKLVAGHKVRLAVLEAGSNEFKNIFNEEFLLKHGFTE